MYSSWVEISQSAILHNLAQYQKVVGHSVQIMPIVKSNAYGHGMIEIAKLVSPKVGWLGVVSLAEALALRKNKIKNRIFVLSYFQNQSLAKGISQNIELPVYDLESAKLISQTAKRIKKIAKVHIKIDTGASRIGILSENALALIKKINQLPNLKIVGVYSHFAASEENQKYTKLQLDKFSQVLNQTDEFKIIPYRHFACSAATLVKPQAHLNLVRLGLGLYGLWPSVLAKKQALKLYPWLKLKPALTWKTKIIQIKEIAAGTKIGYGCAYTAKRKMKIAVLAVGYWEGYDRRLGNIGEVLIRNKKCPVVGRVCMNLTMVDVSKIKNIKTKDEVILLGQGIPAEALAQKIGTINYEVVTRINPLLTRKYIK
ncbi:MAG: alanine racemase [Candidatus Buchananbacteria bacterium]